MRDNEENKEKEDFNFEHCKPNSDTDSQIVGRAPGTDFIVIYVCLVSVAN